jgi:hypothetical protein
MPLLLVVAVVVVVVPQAVVVVVMLLVGFLLHLLALLVQVALEQLMVVLHVTDIYLLAEAVEAEPLLVMVLLANSQLAVHRLLAVEAAEVKIPILRAAVVAL